MPLPAQHIRSILERPHWTVHDGRPTFVPVPAGWRAVINRLQEATGRTHFHVAIVDRTGATRFTSETASLQDAVRSAERGVLARNAPRLVPRP